MDRNRLEREQEAAKLLSTADSLAIISAQLERICWWENAKIWGKLLIKIILTGI
jgi:hypothetical protein